ncbi:hypothetical protein LPJ66_001642 [Kickxella alabastrina]|uniref:Uncharacterized protein n=1 Tax=Kickxella alabastrina TaxID=61397 RepID=A0ACC1ISR7_9FUNG|nr:hypothetical protein LPJ66_001642 [Kickxella alabastrina]
MSTQQQQQQQQPTVNGTAPASSEGRKVATQEVGWMFANEYYTIMNREPQRLHCFYAKKSTAIHGTDGEVVKQANGQQEIRAVIEAGEFKGRKVQVTNVDTLASIDGSIIVQAIGQMDTKDGTSYQRFAQTFLLAEQQGGYYLHNDIMRYLSDDTEDREPAAEPVSEPIAAAPAVEAVKKDERVAADEISKKVEETPAVEAAPVEAAAKATPDAAVEAVAPAPKAEVVEAPVEAAVPVVDTPVAVKPEPKTPRAPKEKPAAAPAPKAEERPAPAPAKPTTWAGLAAVNSNKWNNNTIAKVEGTVAPATPTTSAPTAANPAASDAPRTSTPVPSARGHQQRRNDSLSVFLKNIPQVATIIAIKAGCKSFGPITSVDFTLHKTTGVVEFATEAAKQAALRAGSAVISGGQVAIEERRSRQQGGRREGAPKQVGQGPAPARNGSGEFERVNSSRGSRGRAPAASSATASGTAATPNGTSNPGNRARGGKQ